jgi:hypothetical protein
MVPGTGQMSPCNQMPPLSSRSRVNNNNNNLPVLCVASKGMVAEREHGLSCRRLAVTHAWFLCILSLSLWVGLHVLCPCADVLAPGVA